MKSVDFAFQTVDGANLHVSGWAVEKPKAVVQVLHGMAEYGSRYARLAQALSAAGYTTYAHDHRGHGKSIPEGGTHRATWPTATAGIASSKTAHGVNREIAKRNPRLPIIILGHSMGSFILQQLLFEHPSDMVAAALSGSNGKPPPDRPSSPRSLRESSERASENTSRSPVLQRLTFGEYNKAFAPSRTESDWLSRDPEEVDKYVADPLSSVSRSRRRHGST